MTTHIMHGRYVITMDAERRLLEDSGVAFVDDRITAVGPMRELRERFPDAHLVGGREFVILPGLVNAHMHLACSLFRGLIDDIPLIEHDLRFLFPGQRAMTEENVYVASLLSSLELLKNGVTTTADAYLKPEASARAMVDSGIRGIISPSMMDTWLGDEPGPVITTTDEALAEVRDLRSAFHGAGDGRITVCPAPFTDLTASPELLSASAGLAREWGSILQIHMCETLEGVNLVKRRYGARVFEHAEREGLFDAPGVVAAHCCWISEPDIAIIKEYDVGIAYCPSCEAKMADGLPPVSRLVHEGVSVAISIDATCVNNSADLLREAKVGTLLQKVAPPLDPELLPAEKALEMITIDAARALGLASEVGSLEVGKRADLIALRIDGPHYVPLVDTPRYTIINHLIYAASGADVSEVVVNGRQVIRDGVAVTVDERDVVESAHGVFAEFMQESGIASEIEEMRWSSERLDDRERLQEKARSSSH